MRVGRRQNRAKSWLRLIAGVSILLCPALGHADTSRCPAKTPLEQTYCQIQAAGGGAELPNFHDFRQNPPATQALLLSRLAKKYRLPPTLTPRVAAPPQSHPPSTPTTQPSAFETPVPAASNLHLVATNLPSCSLAGEEVACASKRFTLQFNQANSQLAANALSNNNRLQLPALKSGQDLGVYLSESYALYIDKMLDIGLGASTLTFGKFSGIYTEVTRQKIDFSARFASMYSFLQQDKRSMNAPKRFTQALPQALSQCAALSDTLIVCDDQHTNWIYRWHP